MKNNQKPKHALRSIGPPEITVAIGLCFHFMKKHRDQLMPLRAWIISRALGGGGNHADTEQVMKTLKIKQYKHFKNKLKKSDLFWSVNRQKIFFKSEGRIAGKHRISYRYKIARIESFDNRFLKMFVSNKHFSAYVTKIYFENDVNPKSKPQKLTFGRISIARVCEALNISKPTVISNLKLAKAKQYRNIVVFKNIKIDKPFGQWLVENDNLIPNPLIRKRIFENFSQYFPYRTPKGIFLAARYPNIFRFTGLKSRWVVKGRLSRPLNNQVSLTHGGPSRPGR